MIYAGTATEVIAGTYNTLTVNTAAAFAGDVAVTTLNANADTDFGANEVDLKGAFNVGTGVTVTASSADVTYSGAAQEVKALTYGSLTAVILMMLWLYFCICILFLGAEINEILQEHKHGSTEEV